MYTVKINVLVRFVKKHENYSKYTYHRAMEIEHNRSSVFYRMFYLSDKRNPQHYLLCELVTIELHYT